LDEKKNITIDSTIGDLCDALEIGDPAVGEVLKKQMISVHQLCLFANHLDCYKFLLTQVHLLSGIAILLSRAIDSIRSKINK
jgi:hypothetical protein